MSLLALASLALATSDLPKSDAPIAKRGNVAPLRADGLDAGARPAWMTAAEDALANRDQFRAQVLASLPKPGAELKTRTPAPKTPAAKLVPGPSGRLVVKFADAARVTLSGADLVSGTGADLASIRAILDGTDLAFEPVFKGKSLAKLGAIEARAAAHSGKAQPFLASMLYLDGPNGVSRDVAQAIQNLDLVEFVNFEPEYETKGGDGACCIDNFICIQTDPVTCTLVQGGNFMGGACPPNGLCGACCIDEDTCTDNTTPDFCNNLLGGDFVAAQLCEDEDGDSACDIDCGDEGAGDCLAVNGSVYCGDICGGLPCQGCCQAVCNVDPFCCDDQTWPGRGLPIWDPWCADHALEICVGWPFGGPGPGPPFYPPAQQTPSFVDAQGYQTPLGYIQEFGFIPANIGYALRYDVNGRLLDGFTGEGFDMQSVWELGDFMSQSLGTENLTRGRSIRVGVVEPSAIVFPAIGPGAPFKHEDLHGKVKLEPGQTPLILQTHDGDHGTSTLSIIGAIDHDSAGNVEPLGLSPNESRAEEMGTVGLVPEVDLWFFPTQSFEEGGRLNNAIASAFDIFEPGDVLSMSIGPAGCGTLASQPDTAVLLRVAADLGITCVISAGNDCCNLDDTPQLLETDAIIVGAVFPGCDTGDCIPNGPIPFPLCITDTTEGVFNCFCRLPFSNHCEQCTTPEDSDTPSQVHVAAWGTAVACAGGGDLFAGSSNNEVNRSYTSTFGGTSAAAPMIASLAASAQGMAKMFYGIPLSPVQIRTVVSSVGFFECGFQNIDDRPGSETPQGACAANPSYSSGDWDRDATSNEVGMAFPNALGSVTGVITGAWFDGNPLIGDFDILRGDYIYGNNNSIKSSDNSYLVIESKYTAPGFKSNSLNAPALPSYSGWGQITDVLVFATADIQTVGAMLVAVEARQSGGTGFGNTTLLLVELYDWQAGFYQFVGLSFLGPADPVPIPAFPVANAARFSRPSDNRVVIRCWTLGLGGGAGGIGGAENSRYRVHYDLISLDVGEDFADIFDP